MLPTKFCMQNCTSYAKKECVVQNTKDPRENSKIETPFVIIGDPRYLIVWNADRNLL